LTEWRTSRGPAPDASVAIDLPDQPGDDVELLAIRIGSEPYALRLTELGGVFENRPVIRLPSPLLELRGLCAIRGAIAPVYDLAMLLGYGACQSPSAIVLSAFGPALALGFDAIEGRLRVPAASIATLDAATWHSPLRQRLQSPHTERPIIELRAVTAAIHRRAEAASAERPP
jgi:purine-binding chemotaxis protein CheW